MNFDANNVRDPQSSNESIQTNIHVHHFDVLRPPFGLIEDHLVPIWRDQQTSCIARATNDIRCPVASPHLQRSHEI